MSESRLGGWAVLQYFTHLPKGTPETIECMVTCYPWFSL